ncbi:DUF2806 domain-containing protein [Paraburkholderia dioscoreae]|uniref:DUF2806 domain-containing protein n=1 Tax=Paraburkholderia dioscoreae TaxID=2604047 RepID=A0A5Q4Z2Q6_9BURK|nr:DUF2806 domain-containing protein [Paraburkholderia dioscoreae]VVD30884.1 conserved protein of unknown function [Paraburkholderia dioscoreae]
MTVQLPGEQLLIRLWTSLDRGVSGFLKPWQMKREARAQLQSRERETLVIAQAEKDADEIRAGRKKVVQDGASIRLLPGNAEVVDGRAEPVLDPQSLLTAAADSRAINLLREEINIAKTILKAEGVLRDDPTEPPATFADSDWLYRWRACASQMSSDELQSLFGNVLAGEIKAPGTFSLRTLDFLKNLSREEAEKIQFVCPFITDRRFILMYGVMQTPQVYHDNPEFPFFLQELGLLSGLGYMGNVLQRFASDSTAIFHRVLTINDRAIVVRGPDSTAVLELHGFKTTPLGTEALSLCPMPAPPEYVRAVAEHCKTKGFDVSIASCRARAEGIAGVELFDEVSI